MARVVVIGAGVGGVAAAARLAAQGHAVTVCEASDRVGGKLGRVQRDGFAWDTGAHLLTIPQVFHELFADTGAPLDEVLDLEPLDPLMRYRFADGTWLDTHADAAALRRALLATLGPQAAADMDAFRARGARIWQAVEHAFLREAPFSRTALARQLRRAGDLPAIAPGRTVRGLGRSLFSDPRLQMWLERYATYTGSDPRTAPAALVSAPYAELAFGGWYVRGGMHRLGQAIAERAEARGATIRTGTPVQAIATQGGGVVGVDTAEGERLPADVVVANVDAWQLARDLLPRRTARPLARRLARATPSSAGLALLLGLEGRSEGLAHHNVLFCEDYDAEFDALFGPVPHPVLDPTLYVARPDDPAAAPPGHEAWFVLANAPRHVPTETWAHGADAATRRGGGIDWTAPGLAEREADRLLALLAARGVDVRDRVVTRAVHTPADLAADTGAPGGSIYGTASNSVASAFLRPPNRTHVDGLFLVGGSSHPGGGLPLVTLSAAITAAMIGPA